MPIDPNTTQKLQNTWGALKGQAETKCHFTGADKQISKRAHFIAALNTVNLILVAVEVVVQVRHAHKKTGLVVEKS